MTQVCFRLELSTILAVFGMLVLFGILYNQWVSWLENKGYTEGYTSLLVVGGCLVTLACVAIIAWQVSLLVTLAFSASGLPMILGSIYRHVSKREREIKRVIDDSTPPVA